LLIGLLIWRFVMPGSPIWLDLVLLIGAGIFLLVVKSVLRGPGARDRKDATRN